MSSASRSGLRLRLVGLACSSIPLILYVVKYQLALYPMYAIVWRPQFQRCMLLQFGILSLLPSECEPVLTPSAITSRPTISSRFSNPLSAFSARCNIYISRLCYDVSVRLSVTFVYCGHRVQWSAESEDTYAWIDGCQSLLSLLTTPHPDRRIWDDAGKGSSRAILATARPSCYFILRRRFGFG